jgi:hypothetical protein
MEQQRPAGLAEGQVSHFVEDDRVEPQHVARDAPGLALCLLLLEGIDQIDRGVEPHALTVLRNSRHADRRGQMALAGARPADKYDVVRHLGEVHRGELLDQLAVNLRDFEVEPCKVTMDWELRGTHLMAD